MNAVVRRATGIPWLTYAATAAITIMLKSTYSRATVTDLAWILAPTATVVGSLRRQPLVLDPDTGWMPSDGSFIIAPACAGVNFLILIFAVATGGFSHRLRTARDRCGWFVASACAAYLLTIAVNSLRIIIAVALYDAGAHGGWLTTERVHRLAGSAIYLAGLWTAWAAFDLLSARWRQHRIPTRNMAAFGVPAAYIAMTVVLPLLNGAAQQFGAHYIEHALTVSLLAAGTPPLLSLVRWFTSDFTGTRADRHGQTDDSGGRGRAGNC